MRLLFDTWGAEVPLEFLHDVAHQCWDEARHSEFGAIRLKELGLEPSHYEPILYEQTESLSFLHRFCHLTLHLEPFFMTRKRPRVAQYERQGDEKSRLFADVDWSDEINHVRYGKRWMNWFLRDDARQIEDVKREILDCLARERTSDDLRAGNFAPF